MESEKLFCAVSTIIFFDYFRSSWMNFDPLGKIIHIIINCGDFFSLSDHLLDFKLRDNFGLFSLFFVEVLRFFRKLFFFYFLVGKVFLGSEFFEGRF